MFFTSKNTATVFMAPSLILSKTANKTNIEPGESIVFTIRYRCASLTEHCQNVQIVDNLPPGMEVVSYSFPGGQVSTASSTGTSVTWTLETPGSTPGQLDAGSSGMVTLVARFPGCDASGSTAGTHSNTATLTADGTTPVNSSVNITLNTSVPTCPPAVTPTVGFIKNAGNSKTSINGYNRYSIDFPGTGASYTVTDNIPDEFILTEIDIKADGTNTLFGLEIQCANSGTWHTVDVASAGGKVTTVSELPVAATECLEVNHPDFPTISDHYLLNITAVRWTVPASGVGETMNTALEGYFLNANPFSISDLPNFTAATAGSTIVNCANSSDNTIGDAGETCDPVDIVDEIPASKLRKSIAAYPGVPYPTASTPEDYQPATLDAGATPPQIQGNMDAIWTVNFEASRYFDDLENPVLVDLLDENQTYDPNSNWYVVTVRDQPDAAPFNPFDDDDCENPTFSVTEDWNGTGRTLLKWDFSGCTLYSLKYAEEINLIYSTTIKAGTAAGTLIENMNLITVPSNGTLCECNDGSGVENENLSYYSDTTDVADIDGDMNTLELLCPSTVASFTMPSVTDVASSKWVRGNLDVQFSRFPQVGSTTLTGDGIYHLFIENTGNVEFTQFDVVDILPHLSDNGVLPATGARLSDWAIDLIGNITIQRWNAGTSTWDVVPGADLPLGPLYSTSLNPCRFENATTNNMDLTVDETMAVGPTGCDANPWSASAVGAKSFGFRFVPATAFGAGEILRVIVNFDISGNPPGCDDPDCIGDVLNNGDVAWNSFALASHYSGSRLLDTEPIKVGLQMVDSDNFTSLGNYIWEDLDGDGVQDQLEPGIEGVTVSLYNTAGTTLLFSTLTDADGFYRFFGLTPSTTYVVRLEEFGDYHGGVLSGLALTTQNSGATTDFLDSDAALNGSGYPEITAAIGVVTGIEDPDDPTEYPAFDFGFTEINKVGDYAWYDLDGFGDQTFGEPAVQGMQVQLWNAGANDQIGGGDDTQVGSTFTTGADGLYLFDSIPNGTYFIKFDKSALLGNDPQTGMGMVTPADYTFTGTYLTGNSNNDSDANSATGNTAVFTLTGGVCDLSFDAGLKPAATDPATIKGTVWNDSTKDGTRVVAEDFIPNVTVVLYDNIGFPVDNTLTDGSGRYCFSGLTPNATYQVVFFINDGSTFTTQNVGSDLTDSDANPADGSTATVTPTNNETIDNIDAGLCIPPLIGDRVWKDNDSDGIQDMDEPGIPGVRVYLFDASDNLQGTAVTDDAGNYYFGGYENLNMAGIPQTINATDSIPILQDDDDAEQVYDAGNLNTGAVDLGSSDLELGLDGSTIQIVGLRFNNVDIPQGSVILSSYIQFSEDDGGAESNAATYTIKGEAIDNAPAFMVVDGNISSRTPTSASQTWSPPAWAGTSQRGADQATTDLQLIVQEIVNRSGWAALNSMVFTLTGNEEREAEAHDDIPGGAAELFITYEKIYYTPSSLAATTAYEIRLDTAQTTVSPCVLTTQNAGADDVDSDASITSDTAVITLTSPGTGEENLTYDFGFKELCTLSITTTFANNCTTDGSGGYEADWNIGIYAAGTFNNAITYQRNSDASQAHTLTGTTDTLIIMDIPADGGLYDTLRVWFTNDPACTDTVILKRPVPCPTTIAGNGPGEICTSISSMEIKGTVFEDWNYDGVMNQSDTIGIEGIQVLATDCSGNTAITYTDANGNYQFAGLNQDTTYRIEFILPEYVACWACPTNAGADNGTLVQFVTAGGCARLGLANATDYCEAIPFVFVPCFVAGDPTSGDPAYDTFDAFVGFNHDADANSKTGLTTLAYAVDIGATWGVAYQRTSKTVFTSAVLKRHFGFGTIDGTNPTTGGIYGLDVDNLASPTVIKWIDVNTIGINTGTDPRDGSTANSVSSVPTTPSYDAAAYTQVGKIGIGDIDIQNDETLWLINLNDRSLYGIQNIDPNTTPTAADVLGPFSLPNTGCGSGEEDVRPWALKVHKGKVYIGAICSGESSQDSTDLHAYIFEFDPVTNTMSSFFDFDMNYDRGIIDVGGSNDIGDWRAWQTTWPDQCKRPEGFGGNPPCDGRRDNMQPILADIEFDMDGSMVLGIMDRWGMQIQDDHYSPDPTAMDTELYWLFIAPGDILRVCNVDGSYVFEGGAGCVQTPANTNGGSADEYYYGDHGTKSNTTVLRETALGALLYLPGDDEVMTTQWDPYITYNSAGITTLFNSTGNYNRRKLIYGPTSIGPIPPALNDGYAAKGVGLGDLEAKCETAPIEIGNYVWEDTNGNGIQEGCESSISGVRVELYNNSGTLLAFDTTDVNGQYYFSHSDSTDQNWIAAMDSVEANTMYYILVGKGQFSTNELTLGGTIYELTTDSINSGVNRYQIDSDAEVGSGFSGGLAGLNDFPVTKIITGDWGCIDHSFDVGFRPICRQMPTYEVVNTLAIPDNGCSSGNSVSYTFNVTDTLIISDLNVGLMIEHVNRGDIAATLESPTGTIAMLLGKMDEFEDHYDLLLDSDAGTNITSISGNHDVVNAADYENTFAPITPNSLDLFDGENANGTWTLTICDRQSGSSGNLLKAQLYFEGTCCTTNILAINSATPTTCDPTTNTFSIDVEVAWTNSPGGDIVVFTEYGCAETITTTVSSSGTQTVTLTGLQAFGANSLKITASLNDACPATTTVTAPAMCSPCSTVNILYLCGTNKPNDADVYDHDFVDYLNTLGYNVTPGQADASQGLVNPDAGNADLTSGTNTATADLDPYDVIIISQSAAADIQNNTGNVRAAITNTRAHLLSLQPFGLEHWGMINSAQSNRFYLGPGVCGFPPAAGCGTGTIYIQDSTSTILPTCFPNMDSVEVYNNPLLFGSDNYTPFLGYSEVSKLGANANIGAYLGNPTDVTGATYYSYEAGEEMTQSITAPANRYFLGMLHEGAGAYDTIQFTNGNGDQFFSWDGLALLHKALSEVIDCQPACVVPDSTYLMTCDSAGSIEVAYAGLLSNFSGSYTLNVPAGTGNVTRVVVEALYRKHTGGCQPYEVFFAANNGVTIDTCEADSVRIEIPVFGNDYEEFDGKVYRAAFTGSFNAIELISNPSNCEPIAFVVYAMYDGGGSGIAQSASMVNGFVGAIQTTTVVKVPMTPNSIISNYDITIPFSDVNGGAGANITLEAGGVSVTNTLVRPSDGDAVVPGPGSGSSLFLKTFTLPYVPANTDSLTITMRSNGGASWFIANSVFAEASCVPIFDYGDLPDSADGETSGNYETLAANGGPSHQLTSNLYLGSSVEGDTDGQQSTNADGDDITDGTDDEDGLAFAPTLTLHPGTTFRLPLTVVNTTGNIGYLRGWIDWNNNGNFDDPNEFVISENDAGGSFPTVLTITIPATATTDELLGVRFRLSHTDGLTPLNSATSGEVEDYVIRVTCKNPLCLPVETEVDLTLKN